MAKSAKTEVFVVENAILSFPHLFQPQQVMNQGEAKYSAALLLPEAAAQLIMGKAQEIANQAFTNGEPQLGNFRWPVNPAKQNKNYVNNPRLSNLYVLNAKAHADYPPQIVDENRQTVMDRGKIYAGCVVAAGINLYTYNNMGNIGIGVGLSAIMKTADGEALGGGAVDPNSLFGGVQAQATSQGEATTASPNGMPMPPFMNS